MERDKLRSYYQRKSNRGITNKSNFRNNRSSRVQESIFSKNKILFQVIFSVTVIIIFNIFIKYQNINSFNKIISVTKNYLDKNIELEEIENFTNAVKKFSSNAKIINGEQNNIYIDEEVLENLKDDGYGSSTKK